MNYAMPTITLHDARQRPHRKTAILLLLTGLLLISSYGYTRAYYSEDGLHERYGLPIGYNTVERGFPLPMTWERADKCEYVAADTLERCRLIEHTLINNWPGLPKRLNLFGLAVDALLCFVLTFLLYGLAEIVMRRMRRWWLEDERA